MNRTTTFISTKRDSSSILCLPPEIISLCLKDIREDAIKTVSLIDPKISTYISCLTIRDFRLSDYLECKISLKIFENILESSSTKKINMSGCTELSKFHKLIHTRKIIYFLESSILNSCVLLELDYLVNRASMEEKKLIKNNMIILQASIYEIIYLIPEEITYHLTNLITNPLVQRLVHRIKRKTTNTRRKQINDSTRRTRTL